MDVHVDDALPAGRAGATEAEDADPEFCPYVADSPYERPTHEASTLAPRTWELSETPGCADYRVAVEKADKSHYEIKVLHASLSYLYDALAELPQASAGLEEGHPSRPILEQVGNTLYGVFDVLERRRAELEVLMRARTSLANDDDRAAAEHIRTLGRGFAGGAHIRHPGLAQELETFMKEASAAKLKALAKLGLKRPKKNENDKEDKPLKDGLQPGKEGGREKGRRNE